MGTTSQLLPLPRTVILDYYDSYTNNILTLFTKLYSDEEVLKNVVVIKHDRYTWAEFQSTILPSVDCVILSPGPGRPDNPADIGFGLDLLRSHLVPILGVCLGHQAIGVAFGAKIINTPRITHGHVISVAPVRPAKGLFAKPEWTEAGEGGFDVVVYNSLTVDPASLPDELEVTAWSAPTAGLERTIQGLAHRDYPIWGVQYHPESISSTRGPDLLRSFLASVHTFHAQPPSYPALPEHIIASCSYRVTTTPAGSSRRAGHRPGRGTPMVSPYPTPPISREGSSNSVSTIGAQIPAELRSDETPKEAERTEGRGGFGRMRLVERRYGDIGRNENTGDVFQAVVRAQSRKGKERAIGEVWLDGETPTRPTTTFLATPSFLLTYSLSSRRVTLYRSGAPPVSLDLEEETFWASFGEGQKRLSSALVPSAGSDREGGGGGWKGGWAGWMGYEMKSESLAGYSRRSRRVIGEQNWDAVEQEEVDAAWAWCDHVLERRSDGEWVARGIVLDDSIGSSGHTDEKDEGGGMIPWLLSLGITFASPQSTFDTWSADISNTLANVPAPTVLPVSRLPDFKPVSTGQEYKRRIGVCREAIRQGESYELTLTTKFTATLPPSSSSSPTAAPALSSSPADIGASDGLTDPLSLYLHLRTANPAYYSTYLHFPTLPSRSTSRTQTTAAGIAIISSSPERFLKIEKGVVEMMPIKGTRARVKPGACICRSSTEMGDYEERGGCLGGERCAEWAREEDRRIGEELRLDPKERAENLMIVDLIRADLLSSCPPSSVLVPKLIALESYGVHNLVTTVRGQLAPNVGVVEAVARCFPPGSMTGAPKLRSVGLLEGIEPEEGEEGRRGVYSGEYWFRSFGGGGRNRKGCAEALGCLGYFSIDGTADLSVVIRTIVLEGDQLSLGAGGAITWLSDPEKEWDEVLTKVRSVVGKLDGVA